MDFLKDDIQAVNVFVLTFKESDKRLTRGLTSMMKLLGRIFGSRFWSHSVICGTQWGYDARRVGGSNYTDRTALHCAGEHPQPVGLHGAGLGRADQQAAQHCSRQPPPAAGPVASCTC